MTKVEPMRKLGADDIEFLIDLRDELNTQDTVCQADPRFWVVRQSEWVSCWEEEADRFTLYKDGEKVGALDVYDDDTGVYTCVPEKKLVYIVPDTFFMTLREAQEHIMHNRHNYRTDAHPYAMTAYRSPQVERLWKILQDTNWESYLTGNDNGD